MSTCNLNHSLEDVKKKLESQHDYLPNNLYDGLSSFLRQDLNQETLNEVFHLLKKYDLASNEEQEKRNEQIKQLLS
ncbi:group-specific protein [Bacillus taeanensis]|uniref:Group-specific protein n=1 Tax=Bacillus taeanensis TaxID=273032 RepID=A0A366Y2B4_9BACI|nr:group-specific protein [Bacillus taeanensis]RBW70351.1 group-specific protein [Bacillus taeanensis]